MCVEEGGMIDFLLKESTGDLGVDQIPQLIGVSRGWEDISNFHNDVDSSASPHLYRT